MEAFLKSIQTLTQLIQEKDSLNPLSFDLLELTNIPESDLSKIQEETKDIKLIHVDEFWELTEEIYKHLMLKTVQSDLQDYFEKLQSSEEIAIVYQFHPWTTFELTASNANKVTLEFQAEYPENQIQQLLNHFHIKDTNWKDDLYDFDYKFNFESEVETLFRELAFNAWKRAKETTNSHTKATIKEVNGGSFIYDLDTRKSIQ